MEKREKWAPPQLCQTEGTEQQAPEAKKPAAGKPDPGDWDSDSCSFARVRREDLNPENRERLK